MTSSCLTSVYSVSHGSGCIITTEGIRKQPNWTPWRWIYLYRLLFTATLIVLLTTHQELMVEQSVCIKKSHRNTHVHLCLCDKFWKSGTTKYLSVEEIRFIHYIFSDRNIAFTYLPVRHICLNNTYNDPQYVKFNSFSRNLIWNGAFFALCLLPTQRSVVYLDIMLILYFESNRRLAITSLLGNESNERATNFFVLIID